MRSRGTRKMTAFSELGVMPEVAKAIEEIDWLLPTSIQAEAIPLILGGGDVLMAAETGSGKTGAFCLPVLQIVHETLRDRLEGKQHKSVSKETMEPLRMNVYDRDSYFAIGPDGLLCQARDQRSWSGCRSARGASQGRHYFEATVTDEGLCRVGWATSSSHVTELGKDKCGFGFGGTGKKSFSGQFDDYGEAFGFNDAMGVMIDHDTHTISYTKNGKDLGIAFSIPEKLHGEVFFAAVTLKNAEMKFNFGATPFKGKVPAGYSALGDAKNLKSMIKKTSKRSGNSQRLPLAVIIEPVRELALQTSDSIKQFGRYLTNPSLSSCLLVGGDSAKEQLKWLREGVDIVTGTPGKIDDMMTSGNLDLSEVSFFIVDEVDGLLSGGHGKFIQKIYQQLPKVSAEGRRLQMIVCSATLHSFEVKKLAENLMCHPIWIDLKGQDTVPDTVHHVVCKVDPTVDVEWHTLKCHIATDGIHQKDTVKPGMQTKEALSEGVKILKGQYLVKAINAHKMDQAIIFCRTKVDCDNVESHLKTLGGGRGVVNEFSCVCLHGDRRPQERTANLQSFKDGEVRFLVCTDVAARGIDIRGVPYVINMTLPDEKQNYLHRIGRVGRADRMGLAISLVSTVQEKVWYHSNCANRGKGCWNTALTDKGGCAIWYNEMQYLGAVEEHLGETITEVAKDVAVPVNEFDGKVSYGSKRGGPGVEYASHVDQLASTVSELARMEKSAQGMFLSTLYSPQ